MKLGFVGGGLNSAVGQAHFLATRLEPKIELVAGCFSRNADVNRASAEKYQIPRKRVFEVWEDFLEESPGIVDAVCILTPSNLHSEMIARFLDRGVQVFTEKPGGTTPSEIAELAFIKGSDSLRCFFTYTGFAMIRELRRRIQLGHLGEIVRIDLSMNQDGYIKLENDGIFSPPQEWRLSDPKIPMIYLDLGLHLTHLAKFVSGYQPAKIHCFESSRGRAPVIDTVDSISSSGDIQASYRFSKSSLGEKNSLSVVVFGESGSAKWELSKPDVLEISDRHGVSRKLHRGSAQCIVAGEPRYNHFKVGHPTGYVEALSELYCDFTDLNLDSFSRETQSLYSISELLEQINSLSLMSKSARTSDVSFSRDSSYASQIENRQSES